MIDVEYSMNVNKKIKSEDFIEGRKGGEGGRKSKNLNIYFSSNNNCLNRKLRHRMNLFSSNA